MVHLEVLAPLQRLSFVHLLHLLLIEIFVLAVDSFLLEVRHLLIRCMLEKSIFAINRHEEEPFRLYLAIEMLDITKYRKKHLLLWNFMGCSHFIFVRTCRLTA